MDLSAIHGDTEPVVQEGLLRVVQPAEAIPVPVVRNFVVIPGGNPGELLGQELEIRIRPVLQEALISVASWDSWVGSDPTCPWRVR